jgi:hypothetical protein
MRLFLLVFFLQLAPAFAQNTQVWLSGVDPVAAHQFNWPDPDRPDYAGMFQPNAAWQKAASRISVFKMTAGVVLKMPEDVVSRIFADLKRRNIALAIEMGLLAGDGRCGVGVEGYAAPRTYDVVAKKVKRLGGDLNYLATDEPLWFGHKFGGRNACTSSIDDLAKETSKAVAALKQTFPAIKVGDIEPVANPRGPGWLEDLDHWMTSYQVAVGEPLAFVHADVVWTGPWRDQLPKMAQIVRAHGAKFGVIYNGDGNDKTNVEWTRHAERTAMAVEKGLGLKPDQVVFQSWMPNPTKMLPDTQEGTMTCLVNWYVSGSCK